MCKKSGSGGQRQAWLCVLVWAFFTVATFGICTENRADNTVIFLNSAYTVRRPFLLFTSYHRWGGWGYISSWEGTQPEQVTPNDQRDILYHMASCSAHKFGGKKRGEISEWCHLSSQVTVDHDRVLVWRWLNTCLPMGNGEWISCLALVFYAAFALPVKLS